MTEQRGEDSPERSSVFGNLPGSRPGTRSPLRDSPGRRARASREQGAAEPSARDEAEPDQRRADQAAGGGVPDDAAGAAAPDDAAGGGGLEDLAWAGVAAAAEAATIGVRLASRAMEALRGSDRR